MADFEVNVPLILDRLDERDKRITELEAERNQLRELLGELTDPNDCHYDHNGFCQEHGNDEPCPQERAKRLLNNPNPQEADNDD